MQLGISQILLAALGVSCASTHTQTPQDVWANWMQRCSNRVEHFEQLMHYDSKALLDFHLEALNERTDDVNYLWCLFNHPSLEHPTVKQITPKRNVANTCRIGKFYFWIPDSLDSEEDDILLMTACAVSNNSEDNQRMRNYFFPFIVAKYIIPLWHDHHNMTALLEYDCYVSNLIVYFHEILKSYVKLVDWALFFESGNMDAASNPKAEQLQKCWKKFKIYSESYN